MIHAFLTRLFALLADLFIRCVYRCNRFTTTYPDTARDPISHGGTILACWHSRLFFLAYYYAIHIQRPRGSILISRSRDGDYGMALVRRFKQNAIRGSSSRGGHQALRLLAKQLEQGYNIGITPDGPRGPAFQVQIGIIKLAQLTGAAIVPVSYDASRKKILKSWDRFIIPKPCGRIHMAFGEPLFVPRKPTPRDIESYRQELESRLLDLDGICSERVKGSR